MTAREDLNLFFARNPECLEMKTVVYVYMKNGKTYRGMYKRGAEVFHDRSVEDCIRLVDAYSRKSLLDETDFLRLEFKENER